jgi:starch synthase
LALACKYDGALFLIQLRKINLRILFATSEAYPLIKTGGLADVSGALPAALQALGHEVTILLPAYPDVLEQCDALRPLASLEHLPIVGKVDLLQGEMPESKVPVILLKHDTLYARSGNPYLDAHGHDWQDNPLRFATLAHVAAILSCDDSPLNFRPDIVHCNDWQTGLTPAYLHFKRSQRPSMKTAKSLMSIHNLAFQGNFSANWVTQLGLPQYAYHLNGVEYYGQFSFLKAGLFYADKLATVSPSYANEIQTEAFGFGMQGLLQSRKNDLTGILNGLDIQEWNPANDPLLPAHYTASKLAGKEKVKLALQAQMGLKVDAKLPLLGVVSRLTHQKGLDLLLNIADELLVQYPLQLVLLGAGSASMEDGFKALANRYPERVACQIGYHESLSHQIMAGADIFVMPSRFEPCGLNQMYGLRYGTPPLVNKTGGLADTVTDSNEISIKQGTATGFVMHSPDATELKLCIARALGYFAEKKIWQQIQRNGMNQDLGWEQSAKRYLALYEEMLED